MKSHLWMGQLIDKSELAQNLSDHSLIFKLHEILKSEFSLEDLITDCDFFSKEILKNETIINEFKKQDLSDKEITASLSSISEFLNKKNITEKLKNELNTIEPFQFQRLSFTKNIFEKWIPLGVLVQIMPNNDLILPILSVFEGLLTGNLNIIKLSKNSSDLTQIFFNEFIKKSRSSNLEKRIIILKLASNEQDLITKLLNLADGVVAWGNEESINSIKKITPEKSRFISWGHKISFSYISKNAYLNQKMKTDFITKLVNDIFIYNQQACSAPQCVYIENADFNILKEFSNDLNLAIENNVNQFKLLEPSSLEAGEISKIILINEAESALKDNFTDTLVGKNNKWRILVDSRSTLRASPLYGTIWIKPIERKNLLETLVPFKHYLQTVGISCELNETLELTNLFFTSGATRVRPIGAMQESYTGEPHDGVRALSLYLKRVSAEYSSSELNTFRRLDDLKKQNINFFNWPEKIMSKTDFQSQVIQERTDLFFKSGGSSGDPKISNFTYDDYHKQMNLAADGLLAAGLDPKNDRCMNLFFGGGLYGGFISFFTILENLGAIQFPMSAHMDYEFIIKIIKKYKVNVLLGMPSYLTSLFESDPEFFRNEKLIKKIYFGGEHFSELQKQKLIKHFGVQTIISASYGSVDMGPLGYQCLHCEPGVHHLHHSLHKLEILKLDSDAPVASGEMGRLIFSTQSRQGQNLLRYDIGDLGKWIDNDCQCGRQSPRFQLLGRHGDIFRAAGGFLNYGIFQKILLDVFEYDSEFQIKLSNDTEFENLELILDSKLPDSPSHIKTVFEQKYKEIYELVYEEKVLTFTVVQMSHDKMKKAPASGKLIHIIDERKF